MKIRNNEADRLNSTITLPQFADAMKALDLSSVPQEKRAKAIMDHLMLVMASTVTDRSKAAEIIGARLLRAKNSR